VRCGNAEFEIRPKLLNVRYLHFVNETVAIWSNFKPVKAFVEFGNATYALNFTRKGDLYLAEFKADKIGFHRVIADNVTASFVVDDYKIHAEFNGSAITGKVYWHCVEPKTVEYSIEPVGLKGSAGVVNGNFSIPLKMLPGKYTALIRCGNAFAKLNFTIGLGVKKLYFVNDTVVVTVGFKPKKAFLKFGSEIISLNFSKDGDVYRTRFKVDKAGIYEIWVDDLSANFTVDKYNISAEVVGNVLKGTVGYHLIEPMFVEYTILKFKN
jgi:hypothetical protein